MHPKKIIGAVLTQNDHPVIYISRNLTSVEQKYSNTEREALAVVFAVTRLRHFLLGRKFILRPDHKPQASIRATRYQELYQRDLGDW